MAFSGNYLCTSFKKEVLQGLHDLTAGTGHTFKLALYDNTAVLNAATTDYTVTGEISGTGYTAGGIVIASVTPQFSGTTVFCDFEDAVFTSSSITARGGLVYNTTAGGGAGTTNAVCVIDFGSDKTTVNQNLTVVFPGPSSSESIIRYL
jgi:hypothetical protein